MSQGHVLVTGATGFIAKHCVAELLKAGHTVRGSVRDLERGGESVRRAMARAGVPVERLGFVRADLMDDRGWHEAMFGCTHVLHVASPFPIEQPAHRDDIVRPAKEGTLRVLGAATKAGVKRVVLTSSIVAVCLGAQPKGHVYTEADWTDPERSDITAYAASKAIAERAAWDYIRATPGAPELAVVNPGFVQGPALDPDISTSHEVLRLMAKGAYPAAPHVGFPVSDVRDIAKAHVVAMTHPGAAGERFIVAEGFMHLIDLGRILAEECPDLGSKVPKFELPDMAVRAAAIFDKRLKAVLPDLGHPRPVSNDKARRTLGLSFIDAEQAARASARSLRELKVV